MERLLGIQDFRCPNCQTDWTALTDGSACISRFRTVTPDATGLFRCCDGFSFRFTPEPEPEPEPVAEPVTAPPEAVPEDAPAEASEEQPTLIKRAEATVASGVETVKEFIEGAPGAEPSPTGELPGPAADVPPEPALPAGEPS